MSDSHEDIQRRLQEAAGSHGRGRYKLCLYVSGNSPRSVRAVSNLQRIIGEHLKGRVDLEIVDIYQQEEKVVNDEHLVATPMLVKTLPLPLRRLIGDLSNEGRVLLALDLDDLAQNENENKPRDPGTREEL